MDFFTELLESFSRKHNRSLRLLEAEQDRLATASAKVKEIVPDLATPVETNIQGFVGGKPKSIPFKYTVGDPNSPAPFNVGKVRINNQITASWDGKTLSGPDRSLSRAITFLIGPDEEGKEHLSKASPEAQAKIKAEAEAKEEEQARQVRRSRVESSDMAGAHPEIVQEIIANVEDFEKKLNQSLCDGDGNIKKEYLDAVVTAGGPRDHSCKYQVQFLTGDRRGNVERQLTSNTPSIGYDGKEDAFIYKEEQANADEALEVSRSLTRLAEAAGGDEEAKEEVCGKFKVTSGGTANGVTVYTERDGEGRGMSGRVFNNESSSRSIQALMSMAGCDMTPQSATKALAGGSTGKESAIRGELGEASKIAANDVAAYLAAKEGLQGVETPEIKKLEEIAKKSLAVAENLFKKLDEQKETWKSKAQESVVKEEDQSEIEIIEEIAGSDERRRSTLTAILMMGATTARVRNPLTAVQVADVTQAGEKADFLECYASKEEALESLRQTEQYMDEGELKSRITEDSITAMTAEEVFACKGEDERSCKRAERLDALIEAGVIKSRDQVLYVSK